jgi:hypothetical protein
MKKSISLLLLLFSLLALPSKAQYNPYLDKKRKNKPSAVMARQNKKDLKRMKKTSKRQMRRSRKKIKGN